MVTYLRRHLAIVCGRSGRGLHALIRVAGSGDLDPFVAEFNLDTKPAADCFDVVP